MNLKDGGPAFPKPSDNDTYGEAGMSLRDYFAGQVIACVATAIDNESRAATGRAAQHAYAIADAMIAERDK